jgi:hypothetical protein
MKLAKETIGNGMPPRIVMFESVQDGPLTLHGTIASEMRPI